MLPGEVPMTAPAVARASARGACPGLPSRGVGDRTARSAPSSVRLHPPSSVVPAPAALVIGAVGGGKGRRRRWRRH